jgi:hypothetical protein
VGDGKLGLGHGGQGGPAGGAGLTVAGIGEICANSDQDQSEYFQIILNMGNKAPIIKSRVVLTIFYPVRPTASLFCDGISAGGVRFGKLLFRVSEF